MQGGFARCDAVAEERFRVSDECIHGFTDGLCATCNPKPVAESAAVSASRPTRTRTRTTPRATVRSLRAAARVPLGSTPADTVLEQRIYHLTHILNLPGILSAGAISAGTPAVVELLAEEVRAQREAAQIIGTEALSLADFVPFFLSPEAELWQSIRGRSAGQQISVDARDADITDFVFLVSSVRNVVDSGRPFVVASGGSHGALLHTSETRDDAERMLHRLRTDSEVDAMSEAEFLVAERLPLESVTLIGVANDRVRGVVRELIAGSDFTPKVAVYPPWFVTME